MAEIKLNYQKISKIRIFVQKFRTPSKIRTCTDTSVRLATLLSSYVGSKVFCGLKNHSSDAFPVPEILRFCTNDVGPVAPHKSVGFVVFCMDKGRTSGNIGLEVWQ